MDIVGVKLRSRTLKYFSAGDLKGRRGAIAQLNAEASGQWDVFPENEKEERNERARVLNAEVENASGTSRLEAEEVELLIRRERN